LKLNKCTSKTGWEPPTVGLTPIFAIPSIGFLSKKHLTAYTPEIGSFCFGSQIFAVGIPIVLPRCWPWTTFPEKI
jgi:hypothetical protein